MIRNTEAVSPRHTIVAYADSASIMEGSEVEQFFARFDSGADGASARAIKEKLARTTC